MPKQLLHQPCLELKENNRGSSSGKPVPQFGQARFVEKTAGGESIAPALVGAASTWTTPRPCSSAAASDWRSSDSVCEVTASVATGSSMLCSTNRSSRGHFAVGLSSPSTRNSAKPLVRMVLASAV